MQVASMPLVFVATQATLIVRSAHSVKLLFFFAAVVVIVNLGHTQDCEERRRVYAQDELNIGANGPSPLLPQSSVQNVGGWGAHIFGSSTVQENSLRSLGWWINIHMQSMYPYDALY